MTLTSRVLLPPGEFKRNADCGQNSRLRRFFAAKARSIERVHDAA
jgi:hypothetical protein